MDPEGGRNARADAQRRAVAGISAEPGGGERSSAPA